jgi:hypothetical protein
MKGLRSGTRAVLAAVVVLLLAAGSFGGLAGTPARAAGTNITLSHYVQTPGNSVTVHGQNFHAGDKATISVVYATQAANSTKTVQVTSATVNRNGTFAVDVAIPQGTNPGFYGVVATDQHGDVSVRALDVPVQLTVQAGKSLPAAFTVPGQMVMVSGTGFTAGEHVTISAQFPLFNNNSEKVTKTPTADVNGAFNTVTFQVPWQARDGQVMLSVVGDKSGKTGAVNAALHVVHRPLVFELTPNPTAGSSVMYQALGFVPNAHITVHTTIARTDAGNVTLQKNLQANNHGSARFSISMPKDIKTATYVAQLLGSIGHFKAATAYHVTAAPAAATATATAKPAKPTATAKATATSAPKATATPKPVKASITVGPKAVIPGASAQVIGSGFPANSQVSISVAISRNGAQAQNVTSSVKADAKGNFMATLHTPGDAAAGGFTVTAQAGGRQASGTLHIAYLKTALVSLPARAIPGTQITVTGFGYAAQSTVTITLAGQKLGTVNTDASGNFKQTITVPGSLSTGWHAIVGQDASGRKASFNLQVFRTIATHFYFASLFTGPGYQEQLLFTNATATKAQVHITYQHANGAPTHKTISIPAHSRVTHNVNADLGGNVTAAASLATDVPIAAERLVMHNSDGSLDPGASSPSKIWYFSNGNTSHQYHEQIAVQNPTNSWAQVTLQVQPTHSRTYELHGTMHPQSRMTWNLNKSSHDAVGVIVTANQPVVANRTILIHNGITSKTGVTSPSNHWYFAAGPNIGNTRNWIGVINTTNQSSHMVLTAYTPQGAQILRISKWLRPYDRQGLLMNKLANMTDVAVVLSTSKPSISEQSTFVNGNHNAHSDTFGVTTPSKQGEFAAATTWQGQDNYLGLFNPNAAAIPIVVQYLDAHGHTMQQTYIVAPFAHAYVDIGKSRPNSQLGLLAVSSYPFVALDRQESTNGMLGMTSLGTQS